MERRELQDRLCKAFLWRLGLLIYGYGRQGRGHWTAHWGVDDITALTSMYVTQSNAGGPSTPNIKTFFSASISLLMNLQLHVLNLNAVSVGNFENRQIHLLAALPVQLLGPRSSATALSKAIGSSTVTRRPAYQAEGRREGRYGR